MKAKPGAGNPPVVAIATLLPEVVDIPAACRLLGIGRSTLYRHIANGVVPTVKLGARRLVRPETVRRLLADLESAGGPKAA
jgi:excisionase family DNA binding protein